MLRRSCFILRATTSAVGAATATPMKSRVKPSTPEQDRLLASRYFNQFWTYRVLQLTTSNVAAMRDSGVGGNDQPQPVASDIQVHGVHKFAASTLGKATKKSDEGKIIEETSDSGPLRDEYMVCVVVDKDSAHAKNLMESKKVSLMAGHTDPQIFHWFKQLGTIPPRSIMSGTAELLTGDLLEEVWEQTFVRHPVMHDKAQQQWEQNETKTPSEQLEISRREREDDERRMLRLSNADWRAKPKEKERNPTPAEDIEQPVYVIKPDRYLTFRVRPDVQVWGDYSGNLQRIYAQQQSEVLQKVQLSTGGERMRSFADMDPLARAAPRMIKMANLSRGKLVASVNMNYNLKLTNLFVYGLDRHGLWVMGTQENAAAGAEGAPARETWNEFRLEYGQGQTIDVEPELEFFFKGMMRIGVPETQTYDSSQETAEDFRHK